MVQRQNSVIGLILGLLVGLGTVGVNANTGESKPTHPAGCNLSFEGDVTAGLEVKAPEGGTDAPEVVKNVFLKEQIESLLKRRDRQNVVSSFIKDQPTLIFPLTSKTWNALPDAISKHLSEESTLDTTQYSEEYLQSNIGSGIALQITSEGAPDFYVIGLSTFEEKYRPVPLAEVKEKNEKVWNLLVKHLPEVAALEATNLLGGALKTAPVEMIPISALGEDFGNSQKVTIESPWGEQIKPAGQEAWLVYDTSNDMYYMVNQDAGTGLPASYVPSPTLEERTLELITRSLGSDYAKYASDYRVQVRAQQFIDFVQHQDLKASDEIVGLYSQTLGSTNLYITVKATPDQLQNMRDTGLAPLSYGDYTSSSEGQFTEDLSELLRNFRWSRRSSVEPHFLTFVEREIVAQTNIFENDPPNHWYTLEVEVPLFDILFVQYETDLQTVVHALVAEPISGEKIGEAKRLYYDNKPSLNDLEEYFTRGLGLRAPNHIASRAELSSPFVQSRHYLE